MRIPLKRSQAKCRQHRQSQSSVGCCEKLGSSGGAKSRPHGQLPSLPGSKVNTALENFQWKSSFQSFFGSKQTAVDLKSLDNDAVGCFCINVKRYFSELTHVQRFNEKPCSQKMYTPSIKEFCLYFRYTSFIYVLFMCNMSACCKPIPNQPAYEFEVEVDADANAEGNQIETDADADIGDNVDDKDPQGWRRERPPELFEDDLVEGEVAGEQVQDQDGGGDHLGQLVMVVEITRM